ncbi:hypothetical protein, partial [Dolichospermum circinale]|uniref:hypothetical protein n=1 Tax=Dolichospermum circinale TaxID=109265 RepID=UPI001E5BE49F
MGFTWVKRKDCKVLLQDSTLVYYIQLQTIYCGGFFPGLISAGDTVKLRLKGKFSAFLAFQDSFPDSW